MIITVDEIFVGARDRAMVVLSSSLSPGTYVQRLAHHLDLPGQLPQGYILTPYISGALIGDFYIISRTSPDAHAGRRGMVFSHAFAVSKSDIKAFDNLRVLVSALREERPETINAQKRMFESKGASEGPLSGAFADMITERNTGAIVTSDVSRFERSLIKLWNRLPGSMRLDLKFGLSFGPTEANTQDLGIALVPSASIQRWPIDRRIDLTNETVPSKTILGGYLSNPDGRELEGFLSQLCIENSKFSEIALIAKACEKIRSNPMTFSSAVAALRIVGKLQPSKEKGVIAKSQLTQVVFCEPGPQSGQDLMVIRNIDWEPFKISEKEIVALEEAFSRYFSASNSSAQLKELITAAFNPDQALIEWRQTCQRAIAAINEPVASKLAPEVWGLLLTEPETATQLIQCVPSARLDKALSSHLPAGMGGAHSQYMELLVNCGYMQTEAELLFHLHDMDLSKSLEEACSRDRGKYGETAINKAVDQMPPKELIAAAIKTADQIVITAGAKELAINPSLLEMENLANQEVQHLWRLALQQNPEAWQILDSKNQIQEKVYEVLLEDGFNDFAIKALMGTPIGDWLDFSFREEVWPLLKGATKKTALRTTTESWIKNYLLKSKDNNFYKPEATLALEVAQNRYRAELGNALKAGMFDNALEAFLGNEHLPIELFIEVFNFFCENQKNPKDEELKLAGRIALSRNWKKATQNFKAKHNLDRLKPYFVVCADHLDILVRFRYRLGSLSEEEFSKHLIETICKLYPGGPRENDIWERCGGDPSILIASGSGRDQWRAAIREVKAGCNVNTKNLLQKIQDDYPMNNEVKHLISEHSR